MGDMLQERGSRLSYSGHWQLKVLGDIKQQYSLD